MVIDRRKKSVKSKPTAIDKEWLGQRAVEKGVLERAAKSFKLEAILSELGLSIEAGQARLMEFLNFVQGRYAALDQLREALLLVEDFSKWESGDFIAARSEDRLPTLDEVIDWKKLNRVEIAGGLAAAAWVCGVDQGRAILGSAMPEVVRSAVGLATDPDTNAMVQHLTHKLLFEAGGLLPKGPGTVINVNQQNNVVNGLPQWNEVDKVVEKAYFGKQVVEAQKSLPPANLENVIDIIPEREVEYESANSNRS